MIYEIHRQPAGMPNGKEGELLQKLFEEGLKTVNVVNVENYGIPVLPSLQNGIVLLLHIVKHLKTGLGLRQILDWILYVEKELHDDSWYNVMQPVIHETEYEKLAKTVTRMCQIYLGLPEEDITWCKDIDVGVCERLMEFIMTQGNFGCKVTEEEGTVRTLSEIHNPVELIQTLQTRGKSQWDFAKKYPIFRSFAWLYTCCRYAGKVIQKKSIKKVVRDLNYGDKRRQLFEDIGL